MVNFLEGLYAITALSFVVALILLVKGRRVTARRFAILGAICALLAILLYWYLAPSA